MPNPCFFCQKPAGNDVKELLALDSMGEVVKRLGHRGCYEALMVPRRGPLKRGDSHGA